MAGNKAQQMTIIMAAIVLALALSTSAQTDTSAQASLPLGVSINTSGETGGAGNTTVVSGSTLNLPVSIKIDDSYASITAKRLVSEESGGKKVIAVLSLNSTNILLHLPRAEQEEILNMTPGDAQAALSKFRLVSLSKDQLYSERQIPPQVAEAAVAGIAESKAAHSDIKAGLQGIMDRFNAARQDKRQDDATSLARQYIINSIDLYIKSVEQIQYSAQMSDDMSADEADDVLNDTNMSITRLNQVRATAVSAKTKAEVESARDQAAAVMQDLGPLLKSQSIRLMQARLNEVVKRDEQMERKLECTLDSMSQKGLNTTSLDEGVDELSAKISFAKQDLKIAKLYHQYDKYKSAESKTISASKKLDDAYATFKDLVKSFREKGGEITDCASETPGAVEVVEEQ